MLVEAPAPDVYPMASNSAMPPRQESPQSPHFRQGHAQQPQQAQPTVAPHGAQPGMMPSPYMPQPQPYWPQAEPMYAVSVHELILNQVHYYFSTENLCRDEFLRGQMDPKEGWLPIQLLGTFNRLRSLTTDVHLIGEVHLAAPRKNRRASPRAFASAPPAPAPHSPRLMPSAAVSALSCTG